MNLLAYVIATVNWCLLVNINCLPVLASPGSYPHQAKDFGSTTGSSWWGLVVLAYLFAVKCCFMDLLTIQMSYFLIQLDQFSPLFLYVIYAGIVIFCLQRYPIINNAMLASRSRFSVGLSLGSNYFYLERICYWYVANLTQNVKPDGLQLGLVLAKVQLCRLECNSTRHEA